MILDRDQRLLISSMGWVERGGFVLRDMSTGETINFPGAETAFLRLFPVDGERFLAASHDPGADIVHLTVRRFSDPATISWSLRVMPRGCSMEGDPREAVGIRRHHLATFKNGGSWDHHLVTVAADGAAAELGRLPWYNADNFDLGYQGLVDTVALPGTDLVLVSVQRSSTIVIHDPTAQREVGKFDLAGRHGNPTLTLVSDNLWTVDYDTFVQVNLRNQEVVRKVALQPEAQGTMQFVGDLFVWASRRRAVIPRPFTGDVAVVDPDAGKVECRVKLGRQPLSCVVTDSGKVIARDWKSGDWLEGCIPTSGRRWRRFW